MKFSPLFLVTCGFLSTVGLSEAVVVTYNVNAALSSLRIGGTASGTPLAQQSAGSLDDFFSGTISGDLVGGTLTFTTGGSSLVAAANPVGPFTPTSSVGGAVENYGLLVSQAIGGGQIGFRNVAFDLTTGSIVTGAPPASPVAFTAGFADYNIPALGAGAVGTLPLSGSTTPNTSPANATISVAGLTETLTLPVSLSYAAGGGVIITFDGTIVATRAVPEPAVSLFGLLGLAAFSARRRR